MHCVSYIINAGIKLLHAWANYFSDVLPGQLQPVFILPRAQAKAQDAYLQDPEQHNTPIKVKTRSNIQSRS